MDKPGLRNDKKNSCSLQCIATCREHKLFFINGVVVPLGMIKAMGCSVDVSRIRGAAQRRGPGETGRQMRRLSLLFQAGDDEQAEILGRAEIFFFHRKGGGAGFAEAVDAQGEDIARLALVNG